MSNRAKAMVVDKSTMNRHQLILNQKSLKNQKLQGTEEVMSTKAKHTVVNKHQLLHHTMMIHSRTVAVTNTRLKAMVAAMKHTSSISQ
jgi:hypothetical protein